MFIHVCSRLSLRSLFLCALNSQCSLCPFNADTILLLTEAGSCSAGEWLDQMAHANACTGFQT